MLKVNSKKAIRRLSNRSFKSNVSRNFIAVIAIALTAILFTALFTVGSGMIENIQRQTMRQAGGDGMLVFKYMTDEQFNDIKDHPLIDRISYNRIICDEVISDELLKRHAEVYYMNDVGMELGFCIPTHGRKPEAENEIIMDTKAMKMLGIPEEIGALVTLKLKIHNGEIVEREFKLSGWWEADPVFEVSVMVVSKAYIDAHKDELYSSYYDNYELTGAINSYVMCKNSFGLESKRERIMTESGYSMDENAPNFVSSNVNWSYLSSNFSLDLPTVAAVIAAIALIIFTGYLIIYNIFQISVIKDIRFYGLLKTIGTTGKQVKKIIRRQALILSCIGIPIGLIVGYFIGTAIVPLIMNQSSFAGAVFTTSANPLIFVGSTIFALVTVAISTSKPGRIAASVSPVEAVRYTDNTNTTKKKNRKSRGGAKIRGMAAANLGRNKKRTILVVISMSLSLVMFNTIYTMSLGFDMDKFLSTFVETDYLVSHASLGNYTYVGDEDTVTESMISAIEEQSGFKEGGRFFANIRDAENFCILPGGRNTNYIRVNRDDKGNAFCAVYGLEDFPLGNLKVLEGEIDYEKLKTGKYILEGVHTDDNHNPINETSHYDIGDTVTLCNNRGNGATMADNEYTEYSYEVMAKVEVNTFTNSCRVGFDYSYYLPAEVYKTMVVNPGTMTYVYDVEDGTEPAMDAFLQNYTENVEPVMAYSSKQTKANEFKGMQNMVLIVGGVLSLIIGLIGVLNFINSMLTSILTRKREFAMLQSIGMTTLQLKKMLIAEGLMYTASAGAVSIVFGVGVSALLANTVAKSLWFFTYQFTLLPLIITIPILIIIGIVLPMPVLKAVEKQSIVDRLRENET